MNVRDASKKMHFLIAFLKTKQGQATTGRRGGGKDWGRSTKYDTHPAGTDANIQREKVADNYNY